MIRTSLTVAAAFLLAACGDASVDLERASQSVVNLGRDVLEVGASVADTRSTCLLVGQSEAFCGCLQERLGPELKPEHVDALSEVVRATLNGQEVEAAAQGSETINTATREALVQCGTRAAMQGVVGEGAN